MTDKDLVIATLQEAAAIAEKRASSYGAMMREACRAVARDIHRRMAEVAAEKEMATR